MFKITYSVWSSAETELFLLTPASPEGGLCVYVSHSVVSNSVTPWTVAHQAPLSMEFSRQEYWSGFPFPFPKDLPDPGIEPRSPALQADSLPLQRWPIHVLKHVKNTGVLAVCWGTLKIHASTETLS